MAVIASAYAKRLFTPSELLRKRTTIAENVDNYIDEVIQHVGMWTRSSEPRCSTHFVSATFNLAWVFWEAARRSRMTNGECEFTLIVMDSASLRDAGAVLGNEILSKHKDREKLQRFTNVCQEVLVPVIVMSQEIVAEIPLPFGLCVPSWIATALSSDEPGYQPLESASSIIEENAKESISSSERSSEHEPRRADSNPDSFRKFCDDCTSAYVKVIDQDKEVQAKALALAILYDRDELQRFQSEPPERKLEDIAALAINIWRWPTRLERWEKWQEWREKQAAFDWPGKYARLLSSLKESMYVNELRDGPTSEESPTVLSPIELTGKRKRHTIENEDSVSNHPERQDERQDSKRARPTSNEIEDEGKGLI
ncbi:hypothetical protein EWM64_g4576 [Hericium alpestre]|uniref:DUF7587 domain-containing protein n=1 Tax=Hericium alpestre TaxID=135208 RepID=A0A4Y9ZX29_9AGAM|nr:hypothetical protein EWM64_g4576 [Hericium alpestre]